MTRQEFADGLRAVATFYERHPEIALPETTISNYAVNEKEDAANVLRACGSCEKLYEDNLFTIRKRFGPIRADFVFMRETVCVRKVVGIQEVPEEYIPAHTKENVEWECEPVLAPQPEKETA